MFFTNFIFFSSLISVSNYNFNKYVSYDSPLIKVKNNIKTPSNFEINKIGIVDFRFILKKSNAMKILGNKFLTLEKEINKKIKQKQIYFKKKEDILKKSKADLPEAEYKKRIKLFKAEVFQIQNKYKEERSLLNKSFQKIQKDVKDLLAQVIKDVSIKKKINIVLLKENVFLFNDKNIDFTNEVLELFNERTKSMKIIITPTN